ncbi:MAG: hypothetical protein DME13_14550 [Candidatus Rokuibacteriota bacterium]|nr:MAG: hypothetical protein DME13_14550 [Candidatus Rokubacteria bacterium]
MASSPWRRRAPSWSSPSATRPAANRRAADPRARIGLRSTQTFPRATRRPSRDLSGVSSEQADRIAVMERPGRHHARVDAAPTRMPLLRDP